MVMLSFDEIVAARRSTRSFKPELPPQAEIEHVLRAGLLGPYAGAAHGPGDTNYRRFVVMRKDTPAMAQADALITARATDLLAELRAHLEANPALWAANQGWIRRLELISRNGLLVAGNVPWYVVVAEARGIPPVEQESLAHCLENMWLQATALGLGFRLLSITSALADHPGFCSLLGLVPGAYGLNGCALGYPAQPPQPAARPEVSEVTRWL